MQDVILKIYLHILFDQTYSGREFSRVINKGLAWLVNEKSGNTEFVKLHIQIYYLTQGLISNK
jgi:hypothetical protein